METHEIQPFRWVEKEKIMAKYNWNQSKGVRRESNVRSQPVVDNAKCRSINALNAYLKNSNQSDSNQTMGWHNGEEFRDITDLVYYIQN